MNIGKAIGYWSIAYIIGMTFDFMGSFSSVSVEFSYLTHMYASILAVVLFVLFSYYWVKVAFDKLYYGVRDAAWLIGVIWVLLTIASDFFFWHIIYRVPVEVLMKLYYIWEGNLKLIVLLSQLFTPRLWAGVKIKKFRHGKV